MFNINKNVENTAIENARGGIAVPVLLYFIGVPGLIVLLLWFFFFRG